MKTIRTNVAAVLFLCSIAAAQLFAGAGNNNPTGNAGEFNGDVMTGCHYDPYTANATRSVTDIVVAGGVGQYPLAFTRTANSRYSAGQDESGNGLTADFGGSGNWVHSYQWAIDSNLASRGGHPGSFTVRYDDGRTVTFSPSTNGDPYYRGGKGVTDRLQVFWDSGSAGRAYLIRPDGGKVWFSISINGTSYTYRVQGIIDPYGQTTTISGSPFDFYPNPTGLVTIAEPGGRWIKLYYQQVSGDQFNYYIYQLIASDGQIVEYGYTPANQYFTDVMLTQVSYGNPWDPPFIAAYTYQSDGLLSTCVDPLYPGPMWRIGYNYATGTNPDGTAVVYGQILSENYFDGTNIGPAVSTLTVVNSTTRKETRADGKTRTFTYNSTTGFLTNWTDFKGSGTSQAYDTNGYPNAVTDFNSHTTNFTKNAFTSGLLTATFPLTPADTPPSTPHGVVSYTYGSASCADPNNTDANNPYYVCTATDEGGHTTTYMRDIAKRVTQVNYPDGGSESFVYNSFGQVSSHTLRTGGTETFEYDARGMLQDYRDPYHASGNPNVWYQYDSLDRVSGVTDTLGSGPGDVNHTTSFAYNARGDITTTTLPVDPNDGQRHTTSTNYNLTDGTIASVTDPMGHITSYIYDNYKRVKSVTTPGHNTPLTGTVCYGPFTPIAPPTPTPSPTPCGVRGCGPTPTPTPPSCSDDYTHTDANATGTTSPGGRQTAFAYDENFQKTSMTVAAGTSDAATTSFTYDLNGNLISVVAPKEQPGQPFAGQSAATSYDERNRPYLVSDPMSNVTSCLFDAAGRKVSVTRPNGQITTFDSFDAMNRLLQSTAKQTPDPDAVTKYAYYASGLLHTTQDPHLVAVGSGEVYNYQYDLMGRKTTLTYPRATPSDTPTSESWHYDAAGRVDAFTNRNGNTQRTLYDNLNRAYNVAWDDSGLTPTVTIGYDAASRVTVINNVNANISHAYFNDDLLSSETNTYPDSVARTVSYSYDVDGNRAGIQYPANAYSFAYDYNGRNEPWHIMTNSTTIVTNAYDPDGNLTSTAPDNSTSSSFVYDGLDRLTHIGHALNGTMRTFDYGYDSVGNRKWVKRDGAVGDVFDYDLAGQSISMLRDVANPDTTSPGPQTINYDANGNRTTFAAYGPTDTYATNDLNQYTQRNSSTGSYDTKGNMIAGLDASGYSYDAQSRLLSATKSGTIETFAYDGLGRQVSRTLSAGQLNYNIYDGWNLIGEYSAGSTLPTVAYLGALKNLTTNLYYYHDANGSTSHLTDNTGTLTESYRYDLQGTPTFYDSSGTQVSATQHGVRQLFTGQQWYSELGLYDLRNRFYSPDTGRFLQPDPLGLGGDATNLYRYCHNNPSNRSDSSGLQDLGDDPWGWDEPDMEVILGEKTQEQANAERSRNTVELMATVDRWVIGQEIATVKALWELINTPSDPYLPPDPNLPQDDSGESNCSPEPSGPPSPLDKSYGLVTSTTPGGMSPSGNGGVPLGVSPGIFHMGSWVAPGSPLGYGYGSMGFNVVGVPGTFVTTLSGQTYSTAVGMSMHPMDGDALGSGPIRVATAENQRHPRSLAPFMTWWGPPAQYATAYKWVALPTMMVINSGGVKGYYKPIAWSTDPTAYVPPPTTTPSGHPIGSSWTSGRLR